jgi:hypothetical protein
MKLLADYLDRATQFEKLAAEESNPELKRQFEHQAKSYRGLAAKRAQELGLPLPNGPSG